MDEEVKENPIQETPEEEVVVETEGTDPAITEELQRPIIKLPEKPDDSVDIDGIKYPKDIIEKAKAEGWTDKDYLQKRGKEDIYLDPQTFLERGKNFLPFLNKKVEKKDEEISQLKKMLQKKITDDTKDKVDTVEKQLKEAKEYGNYDDIETLVEKRAQLRGEIDSLKDVEVPPYQPPIQEKLPEVLNWEVKNNWCLPKINGLPNPNFDAERQRVASEIFMNISTSNPYLNVQTKLQEVDRELFILDEKQHQRANVAPPVQSQSTSIVTPTNTRTIEKLTPSARRMFDDCIINPDGTPFTGKGLEIAKKSFLESAKSEFFKK